jgi:hypothetical protein
VGLLGNLGYIHQTLSHLQPMSRELAYISQGKLYFWSPDRPIREVESEFGRGVQERSQRGQSQKAWKNRTLMEMMMPPGLVQQMQTQIQEAIVNISITSICKAAAGKVLYALESDTVSGIFTFDPSRDREDRLFHNADFRVSHLDLQPETDVIACSTTYSNGSVNIATMPIDGSRPRDMTEGDSIDLAPRWIPGQGRALVFQSAGIARNVEGFMYDRAAYTIEKLDFDRQDVSTLAADPKSDLLGPQMDAQGWLYYIRRPFEERRKPMTIWQTVKSILLIPVRLAQALYAWVDFFTRRYTGKPLVSANDDRQKVEPQIIKAWGDWIRPDMLQKGNKKVDPEAPALVPETWQLVRQGATGTPEVLASGVLHYDLANDGTIVYTNGSAIFQINTQGEHQRLHVGKLIEFLALV